ncbi:MAG TPA: polysaccharide biosynthesis/export family protein [Smithella sp.]|nr:polysaccharide biosynthesis/export family protein [Smithella sp.]HRS97600.1 polysaccharide biosynthesis/export family protein [Smithella sp.]
MLLVMGGCTLYRDIAPGTVQKIPVRVDPAAARAAQGGNSPVVEQQRVIIAPLDEPAPSPEYIIGPNDVLYINVSGKPEFSSLTSTTTYGNLGNVKTPSGSRVDGNGNVHLPFIGAVPVGGLTITQAEKRIAEAAKKFINDPWVIIEVGEYKSHPLYLLGQFRNSGTFYMDRPLNLLQGIAMGNGYDGTADLSSARLIRDKKTMPVDIYELLMRGDQRHNVWLKPGDAIYIPDNRSRMVFVFGAVKKAGPVTIPPDGLTLTQAIASAELRDTGHDFRYIRIIRSLSATEGELMVVDFDKILRGESMPLMLQRGDIVYVPKSAIGTWNDTINEILPSLQVFSALLQPFVQIKYLKD